jgi:murein DD-endopeptidase MepM/ murein hydrolase activator NlpD
LLVLVVALVAGAFLLVPAVPVSADLEDDLEDVLNQIDDLEARLDAAAAERGGIIAEILATRDRLQTAQNRLDTAEGELRELRVQLAGTEAELDRTADQLSAGLAAIEETRRRIDANRGAAQNWVRDQYMHQGGVTTAGALLSVERVTDVGRLVYFLEMVTERSTASIDRHQALGVEEEKQQDRIAEHQAALTQLRDELATAAGVQAELTAEMEASAAEVRLELDTQQLLLAELESIIAEFETELDGLDREQERLERLIRESTDPGGGGGGVGQLIRPVPGRITSGFGPRLHPILGYTRMHTGVDMTAPLGQAIRAGAAGTVIWAGTYGGYGLTVIVDHGAGMTTLYAHQSRLHVGRGDTVAAGDTVGEAGATGLATGPHLHFEVRIDGTPVDPEDYL